MVRCYNSVVLSLCERGASSEMAPWKDLPYEIVDCDPEEDRLIKKCFFGFTRKFVKCGKSKYVMPGDFRKAAESIYNMEVRPDDVWVITFPRSGTTWTQEMVWLLMNDLDYETAREKAQYKRFPMLEMTTMIPEIGIKLVRANFFNLGGFQGLGDAARCPSWKTIAQAPRSSPRFIKTHLPLSMLPPDLINTAKVIYVARDPRDACVSYYYLQKMVGKHLIRADVQHYWETFRRDLLPWTPIITHTNEAWELRHHPNLHFMFYEDMLQNLELQVSRVCKFLEKDYSEIQLSRLAQYLSFDSLKKIKSVNNTVSVDGKDGIQFIRKGESGGWREHFDAKMELQAEEFLSDRLKGLTLTYPSFQLLQTTHL